MLPFAEPLCIASSISETLSFSFLIIPEIILSTTITSGTNTNFPSFPRINLCEVTNFNSEAIIYFILCWSDIS